MKYFVKIFFFFQSRKTYVSELYYNAIELINCICIRWQWYFFVFFFFPISIECDTRYRIALKNSWNSRNWSILLCSNRTKFAIIFFPRAPFLFYLLSLSSYSFLPLFFFFFFPLLSLITRLNFASILYLVQPKACILGVLGR